MTSTEFTAGIGDSARVSSKVLKPPGGGSSDIFGVGNSYDAANGSQKGVGNDTSTHSRLFGDPSTPPPAVRQKQNTLHQSSIFDNGELPPPTRGKKAFVRRNPITGEEIVMEIENEKSDCDKEVKALEETAQAPSKPVVTSIRVKNPPGGKSSGIF